MILGKVGYVKTGHMNDFYIKIEDDDSTGGFLILYSKDFSAEEAEGYDEWYPDENTVVSILEDCDIDWEYISCGDLL